jgi:hypothetical protein
MGHFYFVLTRLREKVSPNMYRLLTLERDKKEVFLVPVADMFNHKTRESPEDRIADYEWDGENFSLISYSHYKKGICSCNTPNPQGDQIFICYGDKSNIQLLTGYGFINPRDRINHETRIFIPTSMLEPSLQSWKLKQDFFRAFGLDPLKVAVTTAGVSSAFVCLTFGLLSYAKLTTMCIYALSDEEIDSPAKKREICYKLMNGLPVSDENATKAMTLAIECCDYTLGEFI